MAHWRCVCSAGWVAGMGSASDHSAHNSLVVRKSSAASESIGSKRGPCRGIYPRVHAWASTSPPPRPLQGGAHSSKFPIASLWPGSCLSELPLRLWLAGEFLIVWRVSEVLVS
ncbi:hypothetical protein CRG98_002957 [Punica granatum]|uniref:Uncharacterized protein n=1 Tax=Punica granatum TaxID=22663 RepID=A0A2I0L7G6_PUNGR|nr:hypothetical protein CRG98_002957 [Punica granatum]